MNRPRHAAILILALAGSAFAPNRDGCAEIKVAHQIDRKDVAPAPLAFQDSDFLRLAIDSKMRTTYALGEPIILSLRLVNHTQFTVTVVTNFNTRSHLEVTIGAPNERPRRSYGPFSQGSYPPEEVMLYPLEELPAQVMLWGDVDTPNGLMFPKPGKYAVQIALDVTAKGTRARGKIPPVDSGSLKPVSQFMIEITEPPPSFAPLVARLAELKAFPDLHIRIVPDKLLAELPELVRQYPATPLSPYLTYALGLYYNLQARAHPDDEKLTPLASEQVQRTALADSHYKAEAWEGLGLIYDRMGLIEQSYQACMEAMKAMPPAVAARKGSHDGVRRFLKTSSEMSPVEYWDILE